MAGAHGSRTHHATPSAASPVLKTGGPTGTPPLPGDRSEVDGCCRLAVEAGSSPDPVQGVRALIRRSVRRGFACPAPDRAADAERVPERVRQVELEEAVRRRMRVGQVRCRRRHRPGVVEVAGGVGRLEPDVAGAGMAVVRFGAVGAMGVRRNEVEARSRSDGQGSGSRRMPSSPRTRGHHRSGQRR